MKLKCQNILKYICTGLFGKQSFRYVLINKTTQVTNYLIRYFGRALQIQWNLSTRKDVQEQCCQHLV